MVRTNKIYADAILLLLSNTKDPFKARQGRNAS